MQIKLKQAEIEAALVQSIANKGFSLQGKTITIEFTAGRKAGGLTADVVIEDADIPGFTDPEPEIKQATLTVVEGTKPVEEVSTTQTGDTVSEDTLNDKEDTVQVEGTDTPKPSLFS